MKNLKLDGETIFSIILFLVGAAYFLMTFSFQEFNFTGHDVSAKRMPQILGVILCICAACNVQFSLVRARAKMAPEEKRHNPAAVQGDNIRCLLTFVLMIIYIVLMPSIGFLIMSAIYVFFQILLFYKKEQRNYLVCAVTAIASSAAIYYVFLYGLKMVLPIGLLARF